MTDKAARRAGGRKKTSTKGGSLRKVAPFLSKLRRQRSSSPSSPADAARSEATRRTTLTASHHRRATVESFGAPPPEPFLGDALGSSSRRGNKRRSDLSLDSTTTAGGRTSGSNYSRRTSALDFDDAELPLQSDRERTRRERISGGLEAAALRFASVGTVGRAVEVAALRKAAGRARGRAGPSTVAEEGKSVLKASLRVARGLGGGAEGIERVLLGVRSCEDDERRLYEQSPESPRRSSGGVAGRSSTLGAEPSTLGAEQLGPGAPRRLSGDDGNSPRGGKEFVLVSGASGCGKSYLLSSTLPQRVSKMGGLYVYGKFDVRDEPYLGISQACSEIVGHILRLKETDEGRIKFEEIASKLRAEIGEELRLLANTIAPIAELLDDEEEGTFFGPRPERGPAATVDLEQAKDQFNFSFRKFVRIVASSPALGRPLVVALDNLQWADAASIELLELLLADRESSGIMIVGCYRSEATDEAPLPNKMIRDVKEKASRHRVTVTELELGPLSIPNVNEMLMQLLSLDDTNKTMPLAELCHRRCMGNPFHLVMFLRMLEEERLLTFNVGSFRWTFDVAHIEEETSVTSNIVDMVTSRLEQLSDTLQEVLRMAACLGSSFESELLLVVWSEMKRVKANSELKDQLDLCLEQAVKGHILETDGDAARYRWTHDKVQEAAMTLGCQGSADTDLQLNVGLVLLELPESNLDESAVFTISNLLQCGMTEESNLSKLNEEHRRKVVAVNLHAAQMTASCSAFHSAAKYVDNGVALLPPNAFESDYDLALELHSIGAEVESFIGNDAGMEAHCLMVFLHARNTLDKIRCFTAQLIRLGNLGKTKLACTLCMDVLDELGCKIPRKPFAQKIAAARGLKKVKKDITSEALQALPIMTDPKMLATVQILKRLFTYSYMSGETILWVLSSYILCQQSLKHGVCSSAPFSTLAAVRCSLGNFEGGEWMANQALSLIPRVNASDQSQTLWGVFFVVKSWTQPFLSNIKYLEQSYQLGLKCGHTESACWGITCYLSAAFLGGCNLDSIVADARTYLPQVSDLGRNHHAQRIAAISQASMCLMGLAKDPTVMSGDFIADVEAFEREIQSHDTSRFFGMYQVLQMNLYTLFNRHAECAELALRVQLASASQPIGMLKAFTAGISLFEMARQTRKAKYRRAAAKTLATMRKWEKAHNPNIVHKRHVLEAENFALKGQLEKAKLAYDRSITLSLRSGAIHDAALASERYGEFLLNDVKDEGKAVHYLEKSIDYYRSWGAVAKSEQMTEQHASLWPVPFNIEIK